MRFLKRLLRYAVQDALQTIYVRSINRWNEGERLYVEGVNSGAIPAPKLHFTAYGREALSRE